MRFNSSDLQMNRGEVNKFNVNVPIFFLLRMDENDFSDARPLLADYERLCLRFNKSCVEEMARWAKDPTLVQGMFFVLKFVPKTSWPTS